MSFCRYDSRNGCTPDFLVGRVRTYEIQIQFQRFEIIKSIWNRRHRYPQLSPVELFRQEILKVPKITESQAARFSSQITTAEKKRIVNGFVLDNLMEEFRHLRLAIEDSLSKGDHPKTLERAMGRGDYPFWHASLSAKNNPELPRQSLVSTLMMIHVR